MANTETFSSQPAGSAGILSTLAAPFVAFGRALVQFGEAYYEATKAREIVMELSQLSDEDLAKRGINRADIPRIAFPNRML